MMRCSQEAFAKCPTSHLCGSLAGATFAEGSECDAFNQKVDASYIRAGVIQQWISVAERLPNKEEYTTKTEDGTEYYARLLIAYKTDITEYEIGYYDGYKWMTEMSIRLIKDVVAWMPFPNMPEPPKGE